MKNEGRADHPGTSDGSNRRLRSGSSKGIAADSTADSEDFDVERELRRTSTPPESPQAKRGPKYLIWVVVAVLLALSIVLASVAVRLLIHLYGQGTKVSMAATPPRMTVPSSRLELQRPRLGLVMQGRRAAIAAPGARTDAGQEEAESSASESSPSESSSSETEVAPPTAGSASLKPRPAIEARDPDPMGSSLQPELFRTAPF